MVEFVFFYIDLLLSSQDLFNIRTELWNGLSIRMEYENQGLRLKASFFEENPICIRLFFLSKDILSKLNEAPPEKPTTKRVGSRGSASIQQTATTIEHEWINDEYIDEFNRQKVDSLCQSFEF